MREIVRKIIAEVLQVEMNDFPDALDADNVAQWDSLGHVKLITRLSDEFGINIPADKMIFMTSEESILSNLEELGVN